MDLPSTIPIFALPSVVLFPGVPLPLHIFEPRYCRMVEDAVAGHGIIGMALLRGDWQRRYEESPEIFSVGCAGRLVNVERLEGGKFNILLHGVREFTVQRHIFEKPYRQAVVAWRSARRAEIDPAQRAAIIDRMSRFLAGSEARQARRLMSDPSLSDDMLVNFFSYALEIAVIEKQGLLEAETLAARAQRLGEIIDFRLEESRSAVMRAGPGSDRCH